MSNAPKKRIGPTRPLTQQVMELQDEISHVSFHREALADGHRRSLRRLQRICRNIYSAEGPNSYLLHLLEIVIEESNACLLNHAPSPDDDIPF